MPRQPFSVSVRGADVLRRKLDERTIFGPVKQEMIKEAAEAGQKKAREAAKPHPADKGSLGRAIKITFEDDGLTAIVAPARSIHGLAFVIEEGGRRVPPFAALRKWGESHGYIASGDRGALVRMREQIKAAGGTKGIHFMAQGAEVAEQVVKRQRGPTESAIERAFDKAR